MNRFTLTQTNSLKGFFAIGVVLSHLCSRTGLGSSIGLGPIYTALGYWGVSVFLFISGFGLINRSRAISNGGGRDYFRHYFRNRVLPIYLLNILLVAIYSILRIALGEQLSISDIVKSLLFGSTVVEFGWYLQMCLLFYLFFYFSFRWIKDFYVGITINILLVSLYCVMCFYFNLPSTWFECSFAFIAGMFISIYDTKISTMNVYIQIGFTFVIAILFAAAYILANYRIFPDGVRLAFKMFSSVSFALLIYFISSFISLKGRFLKWLGTHYMEIYVLQGIGVLIADKLIGREQAYLYFLFCLCLTLVLSAICKRPLDWWTGLCRVR